ncbi:MAG TPA: glutamate--tRNA ligase [Candidatus Saccharimonadia bacterium]
MSSANASSQPVRVRFAPSPTGYLHVGSIRSGLFNWLWARHNGGAYVLRIEDTDRARYVEGAEDQILRTHDALGITPDEGPAQGGQYGPYRQSERLDIYRAHAEKLLGTGALYRCWCSPERLTQLREAAQAAGVAFMYDRHCLKPENQRDANEPHVLRFRIPSEPKAVTWDDAVRGTLSFDTATLDDFVALKADGYPTYHFANVVDDHLMKICHVLRADEWIPSTPKHLLLFAAFGWDTPVYAHLPAVQGPTGGKKLSKRDGAQSVEEYIAEGYLPEALRSFLASLGWNDGTTQEVFTTPELIEKFTLDRIQKSPARFDKDRLTWMNGVMIREALSEDDLLSRLKPFWPPEAAQFDDNYRRAVLRLVRDRLKTLSELPELTRFFFTDPTSFRPEQAETKRYLTVVHDAIADSDFSEADLEARLRPLATELGATTGAVFQAVRLAITGSKASPGLFETMHVLRKTTVLRRLRAAVSTH